MRILQSLCILLAFTTLSLGQTISVSGTSPSPLWNGGASLSLFTAKTLPRYSLDPELGLGLEVYARRKTGRLLDLGFNGGIKRVNFYSNRDYSAKYYYQISLLAGPSIQLSHNTFLTAQLGYASIPIHNDFFLINSINGFPVVKTAATPFLYRLSIDFKTTQNHGAGFFWEFDKLNVHNVGLRINVNFSDQIEAIIPDNNDVVTMKNTLVKLSNEGVLYVVNAACDSNLTNQKLDSMFKDHFNFCAFQIISPAEVDSVKNNINPDFYAYVGRLFGGMEEPSSSGIYLLNKDYELTQYPYPVHTAYIPPLLGDNVCFKYDYITRSTIKQFNSRLISKL